MASISNLADEAIKLLYGIAPISRPQEDTIGANLAQGATTMTPATDTMWKRDDYAEFQPDGELVVCAADASTTVAIRRGQRGTTDAAQTSGDVILKNPPYPLIEMQEHVKEVIRNDLWPHVWAWHHDTLTFTTGDHMYDLDQYVDEVVFMYQENLNSDERFHPLPPGWWDYERQINTAVATNTGLLRLVRVHDDAATVYYTAKRRPHVDDAANLSSELDDMIPWGAAAKMMASRGAQVTLDAARSRYDDEDSSSRYYRTLMAEFLRQRDALALILKDEVRTEPRFRHRFRRRY